MLYITTIKTQLSFMYEAFVVPIATAMCGPAWLQSEAQNDYAVLAFISHSALLSTWLVSSMYTVQIHVRIGSALH